MRKFLAIVLAVAMAMSLAAVSFAADVYTVADIDLAGPYRYDSDKNTMTAPGESSEVNRYGEGAYFLVMIEDAKDATSLTGTLAPISQYKEVEKLKVKAEFEMGEDLVESVSVVKKLVNIASGSRFATDSGLTATTDDGYYYFVEVKVASKQTTSDADIIGTFEFNRKADNDVTPGTVVAAGDTGIGKIKDKEVDFQINVFYKDSYINKADTLKVTGDGVDLKYDTNYALKFECDDEVEFSFGDPENDGTNEGTFTVDISGQGKVFMRYDTKANEAIADANPGVKMYFVNFNNVKFNRVGEFVYEMDDVAAAYKVVDGQLVEIKGVEIGADEVTFNTRVLESYVFADAELVNPVVEAPVVEAPVADAVTNPTTGANA